MAYIVRKPMYIAGQQRIIGEVLNDEEVNQLRVYSLVKSGYLAEVNTMAEAVYHPIEMQQGGVSITIPIKQGDSSFQVDLTADEVVQVFEILQGNVEQAAECIKTIEKEEVLILIDATDSRKGIKTAAVEQAKKLREMSFSEQETDEDDSEAEQ